MCSNDGLGKKKFRGFVELFLDPVFRNTNHQNQNCAVAAQDFLANLGKVFGENIARAIVENHDAGKVEEYDRIKQQLSGQGSQDFQYPGASPFGSRPGAPGAGPGPGGMPFMPPP